MFLSPAEGFHAKKKKKKREKYLRFKSQHFFFYIYRVKPFSFGSCSDITPVKLKAGEPFSSDINDFLAELKAWSGSAFKAFGNIV